MSSGFNVSLGREDFKRRQKRERDRERSQTKARNRPFIAWDGEGFDIDGVHKYMLMVNSEYHSLEADADGISTDEAFQFLLDGAEERPDAINIMYGMSYDVNMILNGLFRELPFGSLQRLVARNRCVWNDYDIEYVPRRFFRVSQYDVADSEKDGHRMKGELIRSVSVWDVMQFFQMSFVDALRGMFSEEEMHHYFDIDFIASQKKRRGMFTMDDLSSGLLMDYSMAEVNALVELMVRFRRVSHESGVHLNRYDGAGAGAAALMRDNGLGPIIKTATGIMDADVNCGLNEAVQIGYGAGHVEMFMFGHTEEKVYHYDLVGAFSTEMPGLVDLSDGIWSHHTFDDELPWLPIFPTEDFTLYKIYWDYREEFSRMFPFFYRSPWGSPRISYPPQGYSWVWSPELRAAMSFRAMEHLKCYPKVVEMWKFSPYTDRRPFEFVNDIYEKRRDFKRLGMDGQAGGIKAFLNAIPGKLAQTVGYFDGGGDRDRRIIPPYFNLAYAGMITSGVRAKVFEAMMQKPYSIIALATDGLWSLEPLDLPIGDRLGYWKYEELEGFTSVQPGIYFTRKQVEGRNVHHYRGFNSDSINEEEVIAAWASRAYGVRIPTKRFVSMASITSKEEYRSLWCTWQETERILHIQQGLSTKRYPILLEGEDWPTPRAAYELIETDAAHIAQFEDNITHYSETDGWGVSIETYLSRPHPVPWLRKQFDEERVSENELDWEIIESEI